MSEINPLLSAYQSRLQALQAAFQQADVAAFNGALDEILCIYRPDLFHELRDVADNLQVALDRFRVESRLSDLTERDVPGAHQRLAHVIAMTDEAAHRTMDLVEKSTPLAARTAAAAAALSVPWDHFRAQTLAPNEFEPMACGIDHLLPAARTDCEQIRGNLAELLLAQGYQDLTGQIIRGVMQLVAQLEVTLVDLTRLCGTAHDVIPQPAAAPSSQVGNGYGPVVPGVTQGEVAAGQQDVDALLSGLGM